MSKNNTQCEFVSLPSCRVAGERRQKERDEIWRQAQALRKKVVNLAVGRTEADLNALWNKPVAEEVKAFAGELNESHRLWVLSTELLEEKQLTPWSAIGSLTDKGDAKNLLKFIQSNATKPFDFVLVWDGRSLANRKFLDEELKVLQNFSTTTELWISYKGASRVGRRVFGGSVTKEIGYLKSNVARVRLSTKPREDCWLKLPDHPAMLAYFTWFPSSESVCFFFDVQKFGVYKAHGVSRTSLWTKVEAMRLAPMTLALLALTCLCSQPCRACWKPKRSKSWARTTAGPSQPHGAVQVFHSSGRKQSSGLSCAFATSAADRPRVSSTHL